MPRQNSVVSRAHGKSASRTVSLKFLAEPKGLRISDPARTAYPKILTVEPELIVPGSTGPAPATDAAE